MDIFNRMKSAFSRVKGAVHRVTDEERAGASRSLAPSSTESVAAGLMKNSASSTLSVAAQGCLLGEGCGYSMTAGTTSSERPNDRERGASEPEQLQQGQQTTCSSDAFDTLRCSAESSMVNDDGFFSFLENVIAGKDPEMEQVKGQDSTSLGAGGGGEASVPTPASPRIVSVRGLASHLGDAMVLSPSSQVEKDTSSAARSLKDYELMAYLGRGAFAEVTLARHRQTRALYAIKKISKEKVRDENCVQCTFTERQLLASFKHPFLVKFHQSFQSQRYLYLVLDFAQGGDLYYFLETKPWLREMRRKLNKSISLSAPSDAEVSANRAGEASSSILSSPPPPSEPASVRLASDDNRVPVRLIAFCAVEVALVLEYLHKHGFVYRDLKPENVLMMRDGNIVLTDFGVAKYSGIRSASGSHGQRVGKGECISTFIGTTPYMSPEVLLGQAHDSRIDWWSFGCMLFEMAAGRRPFDADNRYAAVKCIVEQDVQIQPEDFLPTALEVETRMVQLRRQCERRRRHSASQRSDGPRGRQRGDDAEGGDRSARFCDTAPTPPDAIASGREQGAENTHSVQEAHISTVEGVLELSMAVVCPSSPTFFASSTHSMPPEDAALYRRHAAKEVSEACSLLRDLVVALLQRSPEKRLCGADVLEHPFFSCPYVASQLYGKRVPSNPDEVHAGITTPVLPNSYVVSSTSPMTQTASDAFREHAFSVSAQLSLSSSTPHRAVVDGGCENEDDHRSTDLSARVLRSQQCAGVGCHLSECTIERPSNWRELFLNGEIAPPYVPHLRAEDDLRYFPNAVTATGSSVSVQQRVLRRSRTRVARLGQPHVEGKSPEHAPHLCSSRTNSALVTARETVDSQHNTSEYLPTDEEKEYDHGERAIETPRKDLPRRLILDAASDASKSPEKVEELNEMEPDDSTDGPSAPQTTPNVFPTVSPPSASGIIKLRCEGKDTDRQARSILGSTGGIERCPAAHHAEKQREAKTGRETNPILRTRLFSHPLGRDGVGRAASEGLHNPRRSVVVFDTPRLAVDGPLRTAVSGRLASTSATNDVPVTSIASSPTTVSTSTVSDEEGLDDLEEAGRQSGQLGTLTGVAYVVDDYVPSSSKRLGAVLLNETGIPVHSAREGTCWEEGCGCQWQESRYRPKSTCTTVSRGECSPSLPSPRHLQNPLRSDNNAVAGNAPTATSSQEDVGSVSGLCRSRCSLGSLFTPTRPSQNDRAHTPLNEVGSGRRSGCSVDMNTQRFEEDVCAATGSYGMPHYVDFTFDGRTGNALLLGCGNTKRVS